jgi:hypothetical protein
VPFLKLLKVPARQAARRQRKKQVAGVGLCFCRSSWGTCTHCCSCMCTASHSWQTLAVCCHLQLCHLAQRETPNWHARDAKHEQATCRVLGSSQHLMRETGSTIIGSAQQPIAAAAVGQTQHLANSQANSSPHWMMDEPSAASTGWCPAWQRRHTNTLRPDTKRVVQRFGEHAGIASPLHGQDDSSSRRVSDTM